MSDCQKWIGSIRKRLEKLLETCPTMLKINVDLDVDSFFGTIWTILSHPVLSRPDGNLHVLYRNDICGFRWLRHCCSIWLIQGTVFVVFAAGGFTPKTSLRLFRPLEDPVIHNAFISIHRIWMNMGRSEHLSIS